MKPLKNLLFSLAISFSCAQTFQVPVQGDYKCLGSAESVFDLNAQDMGATLKIHADGSYTLSTNTASENGTISANEDSSQSLRQAFRAKSSSILSLQPNSGSPAYEGMFAIDTSGGMFIVLQNNNGFNIRCESAGANLANLLPATQVSPSQETITQPTPSTGASGTPDYLTALSTVYVTGKIAVMTKEWCDARVPDLQLVNAQAFETWQAEQFFYELQVKFKGVLGTRFLSIDDSINAKRDNVFSQLDSRQADPAYYCTNLLANLNQEYNLRQQYPNEYAAIETGSGEQLSGETITIPNLGNLVAGGPLEPGDYTCMSEYYWAYDNKTDLREFVLSLYPDMGLRTNQNGDENEAVYSYNQATGELDAEGGYRFYDNGYKDIFDNYFYDSYYGDTIRSFKFYRDAQNQPTLYGSNDDDASDGNLVTTLCRYKGVAQQPSPAEVEAAQVEAERFKYVTPPGQGAQLADIEGIVHTGENVYTFTGLEFQEHTYLLLKDGTIYKNLQVPPSDLDITASKQYEQENWGTYQRNGDTVNVQWYGSNEVVTLDGFLVLPAQTNERLNASYNNLSGSTIGMIGMGGVVSTYSDTIIFMPDGRFETSTYSTMGSTVTDTGGGYSMNSGYYTDEEGTVGGTSTSNTVGDVTTGMTVTSESTNSNPLTTTGTYTLDGYTLELRYDDGRVMRRTFYFWDAKKDNAFIGTATYSLE